MWEEGGIRTDIGDKSAFVTSAVGKDVALLAPRAPPWFCRCGGDAGRRAGSWCRKPDTGASSQVP